MALALAGRGHDVAIHYDRSAGEAEATAAEARALGVRAAVFQADLLDEAVQIKDVDIDPGQMLYAVHSADGERLAVMIDRDTAFAAAVAHELEPVSVH